MYFYLFFVSPSKESDQGSPKNESPDGGLRTKITELLGGKCCNCNVLYVYFSFLCLYLSLSHSIQNALS